MSGLEGRDWSLLEATQNSLREHMAMVRELQTKVSELENVRKAVIGQYKIVSGGHREGTLIGSTHWPKIVDDAGMTGEWMELAFIPLGEPINP
jgi:hypothetical protein